MPAWIEPTFWWLTSSTSWRLSLHVRSTVELLPDNDPHYMSVYLCLSLDSCESGGVTLRELTSSGSVSHFTQPALIALLKSGSRIHLKCNVSILKSSNNKYICDYFVSRVSIGTFSLDIQFKSPQFICSTNYLITFCFSVKVTFLFDFATRVKWTVYCF